MTLDPDAGLDLDLLKEMDLQPISALTSRSLKDLKSLHKKIQTPWRSLAGSKKGANFSEEDNQKFENLKRYNQSLKALIQGKKASIVPTRTGQGIKSKNPYKFTSDGMFGNLCIDKEKLNDFKLEAYKDDKKVG